MLTSLFTSLLFASYTCILNGFIIVPLKAPRGLQLLATPSEVSIDVELGDGFKALPCKFKPIFGKSRFFVSTIEVPFSIDVERPPRGFPAPIGN